MTTIACDGLTMAGDGQAEAQGTIVSTKRQKVFRLNDGSLFGASGRTIDSEAVAKWLVDGGKKPKVKSEFTALRLHPDGRLDYLTDALEPVKIDIPAATGSGMDFALGAMSAGATAEKAVGIAARFDPSTGGEVICLAVNP